LSIFQLLFVLINGAVKSNIRSLGYFGLKSGDPPRVGIYDGQSDMKWLLPRGRGVSSETVRVFCQAFLNGELKVIGTSISIYKSMHIIHASAVVQSIFEDSKQLLGVLSKK